MQEDIRLYCGIGETTFNHHPVYAGRYACISPVCGRGGIYIDKDGKERKRPQKVNRVMVPDDVQSVLLDSGAYSDTTFYRLSLAEALERQLDHARRFNYLSRVQRLVAYDVLVDEQAGQDGERVKQRMNADLAKFAVEQTIKSAEYLASQRDYIYEQVGHPVSLVFSAQGSDAAQYLECARAILPYLQPGDTFGLGGWCILGQRRTLLPTFYETIAALVPELKEALVKDVHIFGVCLADALGALLFQCDYTRQRDGSWQLDERRRIRVSTDSVGPTTRIVRTFPEKPGYSSWGYSSWYEIRPVPHVLDSCKAVDENGNKAPACEPGTKCRGLERARHVEATSQWLANFRQREAQYYKPVEVVKSAYQQMSLFEEVCDAQDIA